MACLSSQESDKEKQNNSTALFFILSNTSCYHLPISKNTPDMFGDLHFLSLSIYDVLFFFLYKSKNVAFCILTKLQLNILSH